MRLGWIQTCPICSAPLAYKLSGRGKHYGAICTQHGFMAIYRNPLLPPPPPRPKSWLRRLVDWLDPQ